MKTLFISQDLWDLVEDGYKELESTTVLVSWSDAKKNEFKEYKKKDAKALFFIQQGVSKAIFPRISFVSKSKEAWEILKVEFQESEKVISIKLQTSWKEFNNLLMKESETIQTFFNKIFDIVNQIKSYGDVILTRKIVEKILRSLPHKFDHVVATIEE